MPTWKDIPGYDGHYQIARDGRVRVSPKSTRPPRGPHRIPRGGAVASHRQKGGYWAVNLRDGAGVSRLHHVHRLLMLTFRTPSDTSLQVNHRDGDKNNNSLDNLEWCTHQENLTHAWETGLRTCPSPAKLTPDEVREIRRIWASTERGEWTLNTLGRRYGVTQHAIWRIVHYKNWPHVTL